MSRFWEDSSTMSGARVHAGDEGWLRGEDLVRRADAAVADLPPRSVFALRFATNAASVAVYLGALRRGHVPLLIGTDLSAEMLDPLCRRFGIGRLFDGTTWTSVGAGALASPAVHPSLGLLMSTSGSTGSPKLVRLSLENLAANAGSIREYLALATDDVAITSLPLSYSYGLSVLNSHLAVGAGIVLSDSAVTTPAFWNLVRAEGVTGLTGVPTTWRMLRRMRFERMDLPNLRHMTQAGGRLDPEEIVWLGELAQRTGRRAFIMYGQTEATARIAYLPPTRVLDKPGSIGQAIPGGELWLIDTDGAPVTTADVEGQLVYRGPNVMLGYAESAQDLALGATLTSLPTGDLARQDAEGHFWITGRLKRFVKLFGNRFGLDEVEQHLRTLGLDAGAVGRDDALMIGVVTDTDSAAALRLTLATRYHVHPSAIQVHALATLPRNSAGKLLHGELQQALDRLTATGATSGVSP
ncbi:AMP-binding protein [Roseateles sp.]|uniref:AMP-binding protein n=1 Tax=Roseateles sp. TaxID=1971397 RepID=UPI003BA683B5